MSLGPKEQALISALANAFTAYAALQLADCPQGHELIDVERSARNGDRSEFAHHIHVLQRQVMARSAQREYPDMFTRRPVEQ
jgi:hypothetical protein